MKPLRTRLQEMRQRSGLPWEVLERDYLLSWILAGISRVDVLRDTLVFKGGTALKKCYFGEYRFSEDLDFTGVGSAPTGRRMKMAMDEKMLKPHPYRAVLHDYGEPLETQVQVYSLEEVVAEKLRAILQHARALEHRGWVRSRARDYYDLWRILDAYRDQLDVEDFPEFLREKCSIRDVTFSGIESFFPETMLAEVEKTWKQWLGPLVPELPPCKVVIEGLRSQVATLL